MGISFSLSWWKIPVQVSSQSALHRLFHFALFSRRLNGLVTTRFFIMNKSFKVRPGTESAVGSADGELSDEPFFGENAWVHMDILGWIPLWTRVPGQSGFSRRPPPKNAKRPPGNRTAFSPCSNTAPRPVLSVLAKLIVIQGDELAGTGGFVLVVRDRRFLVPGDGRLGYRP